MPANPPLQANKRLNVVLCWHMHQPEYRDRRTGVYQRPWTYLRAIKDYTDMAAHLEQVPNAHAVVNFAPILLEQIIDYSEQLQSYLDNATALRDPLLLALAAPTFRNNKPQRKALLDTCLTGYLQHFVDDYPHYGSLHEFAQDLADHPERIDYINDGFFSDLLVWYHLSWLGETIHRNDPRVHCLLTMGRGFTLEHRNELLAIICEQISAIIPRYRTLAETSQVELAMTPFAHPLAPLLMDLHSAHEATPNLPLPESTEYPGGTERLRWHIDAGRQLFENCFGKPPKGCWPAEGAISDAVLAELDSSGFLWTASGAGVLHNSLDNSSVEHRTETALYHPYRIAQNDIACFFRDDQLSDLIGFTYSSWHGDDAVANLIHNIEGIAARCGQEGDPVVTIIMDGENAWEHYPDNGFYFLQGLYRRLANHRTLNLTTFSECLNSETKSLDKVTAGSWIYGNLTTWIGSPQKNRAWDMLVDAKHCFDEAIAGGRLSADQMEVATRQLAVCEGSDWFWWPGDYNSREPVDAFDSLFRIQLTTLYGLIGEPAPAYLEQPFNNLHQHDSASGGTMRRTQ